MKPRVIANVSPLLQVAIGPYIRRAQACVAEHWSVGSRYEVEGRKISLVFACGLPDTELDNWIDWALNNPQYYAIIVAGDDSVMMHSGRCWCGDASSFDQSQSFGPLEFERTVLELMGVPLSVLKLLEKMSLAPYIVRSKNGTKMRIDRRKRPMRDTGGPETSLGNSIVMAAAWIWAIVNPDECGDPCYERAFAWLGIKMKLTETMPTRASFLKGLWLWCGAEGEPYERFHWCPAPTRVLKFGKCIVDPRDVFGGDLREAVLCHAANLSAQYAAYVNLPILGGFVRRYDRAVTYVKTADAESSHVTQTRKILPAKVTSLEFQLAEFYNVDYGDIVALHGQIASSEAFSFLEHPAWAVLARRDYE